MAVRAPLRGRAPNQVTSGAHPRYARNPGTGEDPYRATRLQAVDIKVLHGSEHPSALVLSVLR